jgi:hypothetical protein
MMKKTSGDVFLPKRILMKKIIVCFFVALVCSLTSRSQISIPLDSLSSHIGDSVKVCGKIYGGIYLERSNNKPTLLNMGAAYPNSPLTILIWDDVRKQFKEAPEIFFKDKDVCVFGKVILYKDKPEIIVYDESQVVFK